MKIIYCFIMALLLATGFQSITGQTLDPFIQTEVDNVSFDTLYSTLQTLENLGIKQIGTDALENTAQWLINTYQGFGYTDIQLDSFNYTGHETYNIVVTKQGYLYPDTYLIIDGHYDTRTGPGVNDNGSGIAIILEIARLLQNVETAWSVKFINFSCEENGLVGSTHYVNNVVIPQNLDIKLVFNIDEVGGVAGLVNDKIVCERDESSPTYNNAASWAFTDTLANLTELYSNLMSTISFAYGSDYVPFQINGEIITGLFEYNYSPYHHTLNDSLVNLDMDYVYEIAKLSVAAGFYFSGAVNPLSASFDLNSGEALVYPNPFNDQLWIRGQAPCPKYRLILTDTKGSIQRDVKFSGNNQPISTGKLSPGLYIYWLEDADGSLIKNGTIVKIN